MKPDSNRKNSLFWRFRRGKDTPWSFLFGTMHTWELNAFNRNDVLYESMMSCDQFFTEIDLDASKSQNVVQSAFISTGHSIREELSTKRYFRLRKILLKSFHLDIHYFDQVLPLITMNQMAFNMLKNDAVLPMDQQLWEKAKAMHKNLKGLEPLEQQITTLRSIPWDFQLKQLLNVSQNIGQYRKHIVKLTALYRAEKIYELVRLTAKSLGPFAGLMLHDRNRYMTKVMTDTSKTPSFYAVGAAHLGGYYGILRQLKLSGHEVKPIK